jgi:hypothetical protein
MGGGQIGTDMDVRVGQTELENWLVPTAFFSVFNLAGPARSRYIPYKPYMI